jgi:DNA-binding NarL/FixJ family response regulator
MPIERPLSERQGLVLTLLMMGRQNKEIARDLGISVGTTKVHLLALYRALGVRNRAGAVAVGLIRLMAIR